MDEYTWCREENMLRVPSLKAKKKTSRKDDVLKTFFTFVTDFQLWAQSLHIRYKMNWGKMVKKTLTLWQCLTSLSQKLRLANKFTQLLILYMISRTTQAYTIKQGLQYRILARAYEIAGNWSVHQKMDTMELLLNFLQSRFFLIFEF